MLWRACCCKADNPFDMPPSAMGVLLKVWLILAGFSFSIDIILRIARPSGFLKALLLPEVLFI
jgi:hypothetical protein